VLHSAPRSHPDLGCAGRVVTVRQMLVPFARRGGRKPRSRNLGMESMPPHPPDHPARRWLAPTPHDLERLWQAELPTDERRALENAFERHPDLRIEAGALLRGLDRELRETFVSCLARAFASKDPPPLPGDAVRHALERTRTAAFWLELATVGGRLEPGAEG
jgi:hypothetical protein